MGTNSDSRILAALRQLGVHRHTDLHKATLSYYERIEKPHPRLFHTAVQRYGVQRDETLFVGDQLYEDFWGATDAGLQALWLDRGGVSHQPPKSAITPRCSSADLALLQARTIRSLD